jgi:hypothetical protein
MIIFGCTNRQIHFRNGEIHSFDSYPKLALVLCPGYHLTYPILPSSTDQLHRERAVTGRIFQALPNFCPHRQTDTMFAEDPITTIITIKRFAEITLAKLCVRTCCTMRSHEHVKGAVTGRIFQALPNFCPDRRTDGQTPS